MTTSSAPGKIYLFGEHAVVYGEPAIPCAIDRRARVQAASRADGRLRVDLQDLTLDGFTVTWDGSPESAPQVDVPDPLLRAATGYLTGAIEVAKEAAEAPAAGFDLTVESELPLGAGLGSSAAVVCATIDAASRELGTALAAEEIARLAYEVESTVQGGQASRADTYCSAMGGAVRVEGSATSRLDRVERLPLVVGYDGGAGDTGRLVEGVGELREQYEFAADTVGAIGDLVEVGERALAQGALAEVGRLMSFDHGLLSSLGVSSGSLDAMVWAARDAGAHGAKLTGAGGGGCIVALDETGEVETALAHTPSCRESFRAPLDRDGVRQE